MKKIIESTNWNFFSQNLIYKLYCLFNKRVELYNIFTSWFHLKRAIYLIYRKVRHLKTHVLSPTHEICLLSGHVFIDQSWLWFSGVIFFSSPGRKLIWVWPRIICQRRIDNQRSSSIQLHYCLSFILAMS